MNSISDYVRQRPVSPAHDAEAKILHLRERAMRHQQEAQRLLRSGDPRQAAMHASIARTHSQSAVALEAEHQHAVL